MNVSIALGERTKGLCGPFLRSDRAVFGPPEVIFEAGADADTISVDILATKMSQVCWLRGNFIHMRAYNFLKWDAIEKVLCHGRTRIIISPMLDLVRVVQEQLLNINRPYITLLYFSPVLLQS